MTDPIQALAEASAWNLKHQERITELERQLAEAQAAHAADLEDLRMLMRHCTAIYEYASGGVVTKPNTLPSEVIALSQERENRDVEDAVAEAIEEAAKAAVNEARRLDSLPSPQAPLLVSAISVALDKLAERIRALAKSTPQDVAE